MRWFLACLALIAALPAFAQQRPDGWSIGGFATIGQSIYVGDTFSARVLPGISYKRGAWSYGFNGISGEIQSTDKSSVKLLLRPRIFGLITSDAPELDGINRNLTADLGASWSYDLTPQTSLEVTALQEVTGAHNGQEVKFEVEQKVNLGVVPFWLSGGATWQSDDLAGYLYGVSSNEAKASRAAYAPGAVLIPSISATTGYPINDRTLMFGSLTYRMLPDEVSSSPIIARDDQVRLSLGVNYNF